MNQAAATVIASPETVLAPPRRLYYGYVMLPIATVGLMATAPAQTFGVSTFNEPLRNSLGLSHSELSGAYMLGTLLAALPLTYVGALLDRHGIRKATFAASLALGMACLVTAAAAGWWSIFIGFLMLRMTGAGALAFVSSNTLPHWFDRRLGTLEGMRWMGIAIAMGAFPLVSISLIEAFGWRVAYALLGLGVWGTMLPLSLLVRDRPADVGQRMDGGNRRESRADAQAAAHAGPELTQGLTLGETLRTKTFWIVAAGAALFGVIYTAVFFHSVPLLADRGLAASAAAGLIGACAASLAVMHLGAGMLSDRLGAPVLLGIALATLVAGLLVLQRAETAMMVQSAGVLMGAAQGLYLGVSQPLWARYFGRRHLGKIRGVLSTLNVGSSSIGPILFGLCRDSFGSFDAALTVALLAPLPLLLMMVLVRPPTIETSRAELPATAAG